MKNRCLYLLLVIIALLDSHMLFAQTISLKECKIGAPSGCTPVTYNKKQYTLVGSSITFTVAIDSVPAFSSFSYNVKRNGNTVTEKEITSDDESITDGTFKVEVSKSYTNNNPGSYVLSVTGKLNDSDDEVNLSVADNKNAVTVCSLPSVSYTGDWSASSSMSVWDDMENNLGVSVSKDDNCTIKYSWFKDKKQQSGATSASWKETLKTGDDSYTQSYTIYAHIDYYAPDGNTNWSAGNSDTKEMKYTVWKSPKDSDFDLFYSLKGKRSDYSTMYIFKGYDNSAFGNRTLNVTVGLKTDAWSLAWMKGSSTLSNTSTEYTPEAENEPGDTEYSVEASYRPDNGLTARKLSKKTLKVVTVSAPDIQVTDGLADGTSLVIWNTTKNTIPFECRNSDDALWETTLEISDGSSKKTFQTKNGECKVDVGELTNSSGTSKADYKCTVTIDNKDPNGDSWYSYMYERRYEVWKKPVSDDVIRVYSVTPDKTEERDILYLYPGYDDSGYSRRYYIAEITQNATLSSLWRFEWRKKEGNFETSSSKFYPQYNDNVSATTGKVDDTYTLNAMYAPTDLIESEEPYRFAKDLTVETWPTPSIEPINWKNGDNIDIWDNTTLFLYVDKVGGYNEGWDFSWSGTQSTDLEKGFSYKGNGSHREFFQAINRDPNGEEWFRQSPEVFITSYEYPQPSLDSEFKTYLNYEKAMEAFGYDSDDKYSWYKNGTELVSTSYSCMPSTNKDTIQGHDRDTVSYKLVFSNIKDNMPDSIECREELFTRVILWPEPMATLNYNSADLYDGQTLNMSIDFTECIDNDGSSWELSWFRDNKKVSNSQSYSEMAENTTNDYTTVKYSVIVSNLLDNGYTDKTYKDTIPFELRVKPLLSVRDTLLFIPPGNSDPRYSYDGSFDKDNFVWNILKGCDVKYFIDLAPSTKIKSLTISLLNNSGDAVDLASYDNSDNSVVFPSSSYGTVGDYSLHIEGELEYTEYSELGASRNIYFTQAPKVRVSALPSASPSLWDEDKCYVVWTDSVIKTGIKIIEPSQIDGKWKYEWSKSSESTPELSYSFYSSNGENKWLDTISVRVNCYAPDGKTLWYSDSFSRDFEVWKVPDMDYVSEEWLSSAPGSPIFTADDMIDVCSKYKDDAKIVFRVSDDGNEELIWTYSWSKLSGDEWVNVDSELDSVEFMLNNYGDNLKDSIFYRLETVVTPTISNLNYSFINNPIRRYDVYATRIWPMQSIEDVTDYHQDENGKYLVVQAPDKMPNLQLNRLGGLGDECWSVKWNDSLNNQVGIDTVSINAANEEKTSILNKYTADIHVWGPDGLDWYCGDVISYNVKVYPDIQDIHVSIAGIDDNDNGYTALYSEDTLTVELAHGYTFDGGQWTYKSSLEENTLNLFDGMDERNYDNLTTQVIDEAINGDSISFSIDVQCVTIEGFRLRDIRIDRELMIWPRASIKVPDGYSFANISHHLYQGDVIDLKPDYEGPDSVGWDYTWTDLDNEGDLDIEQVNQGIYTYTANKGPVEPTIINYNLKGIYQRDGARPLEYDNLKFAWKEYRKANLPNKPGDEPTQIRENDSYTYKVTGYKYGNPNGWEFVWKVNGKVIENGNKPEVDIQYKNPSYSNEKKDKKTYAYTLEYRNVSPDGTVWESNTITFDPVTVYRRPRKPEIKLKGDNDGIYNNSNIYVATITKEDNDMLDYSSNDFSDLDYLFVFGDLEDKVEGGSYEKWGTDIDVNGISVPFKYYGNSKPQKPYVRTLWIYDDGFRCYSDASIYNNTATTKGMIGELVIENNGFCAEFPEPVTAQVDVCSMTGELIRSFSFGTKTIFNETLNLEGMDSGVYIIRYRVGNLNEVRKIVIR